MSDVPKQLGKYQIRRAIGKGAMGIVYEGFDPIIDRVVAIKTIKKDELDAEEAEEHSRRFLIEAKAAGRLNHKNIVGIYDYGEEKGLSFIVMEFVQGKELKSFFAARHPFSMSQIVRLMGELLDALGYSHSRGVVHRDVKPDNIFVTDDGSVKLGDFGIARIDSTSKTHAGTVLGTPSYMSPEQIRGETADARSDLYAAGVILYQFLVGERPFSGGMVAVMQKVLMEAPKPPSSHNPSIPEAIDSVVLKALAKAASDRFASAAEFSRELTAAVGLADAEDESESTMIMSAATLKALQEGIAPADRTSTGSTHTGTGTGTGTGATGATGATGPTGRSTAGGRGAAIEEAKRRAEEAKRRYEEDLKRAEVELQQAEAEQRAAEAEAQSQADDWFKTTQAMLAEAAGLLEAGQALFAQHTLLVDGPANAAAGRAVGARMRESAAAIGEFIAASYALAPATQTQLEARQAELAGATAAQDALAERVEREGRAALASFEQKLEVLEKRLAGQDGAWGSESRALAALDAAAGEEAIAPIQARLDKLAASVEQVSKGFASVQAQPMKLPTPQAERLAVIEAQLQAQGDHVARLRGEADAARERARAAAEARRLAEEEARRAAEAEAARKKAQDEARRKAEAEAAAEARRLAEEKARHEAEAARKAAEEEAARKKAEAEALAEARRLAEEKARQEAEAAAQAKAQAEAAARAEAETKRLADEQARAEAAAAAEAARKEAERLAAEKKRLADEEAARVAEADARRKAEQAAEAARKKAEDEARRKAEAEAKAEAKRVADEQARRKAAEAAQRKADEEARRRAEAEAKREAKAKADAAAQERAAFEAKRRADEEASRKAELEARRAEEAAAPADGDPDATMVGKPSVLRDDDDADATMVRPGKDRTTLPAPAPEVHKPPVRTEPPQPPAPVDEKKKSLLVPIAGAAVVVLAAGAWFALRPAPTPSGEPSAPPPPVAAPAAPTPAPAPTATPAPAPAPAPAAAPAPAPAPTPAAPVDNGARNTVADDAAARHKAELEAKAKADAEAKAKAKAELDAQHKADAEAKAKADADRAQADADARAKAKADADAKAKAKADADAKAAAAAAAAAAANTRPAETKPDTKADAADTFRKGYEAYLAGRVPEGIRMMERADAMGAPGARARLCAIYRKPTAAEGKDFLKEANKCKGVD